MDREIKVLLVDENRETLALLAKQLSDYPDVTVVGEAGFGPPAYTWASRLEPDVVLVAMEEPVVRALKTIEGITLGQSRWPVVVISSKIDYENLRKAMRAGADDYVAKRSAPEELHTAIVSMFRREQQKESLETNGVELAGHSGTVISVFGVKGGIGKTTLATNLAASLSAAGGERVALIDLDLQFGDVAMVMGVSPQKTIADIVDDLNDVDAELIGGLLAKDETGVAVLPAPLHVQDWEKITGGHVQRLLELLATVYDYVILDAPNALNETVQAALDASTLVFLVTTPEISCIKRTKSCLDLIKYWDYSEDKVKLVINKANWEADANPEDIEEILHYQAFWKLPFDQVADSVKGSGGLFVRTHPDASISTSVLGLTHKLLGVEMSPELGLSGRFRNRLSFLADKREWKESVRNKLSVLRR